MYETLNMGIVLEPKGIGHWVSLVGIGTRIEMWTRGLQKMLVIEGNI
jgi:hypothetical protein